MLEIEFGEATAALLLPSPPVEQAGHSTFLQDLQAKYRADERTRTADLTSLRVRNRGVPSIAAACYGFQNPLT